MRLKFSTNVAEDDIVSMIKNSIVDGKLGELRVNVTDVFGIVPPTTTAATPTSAIRKSDGLFLVFTDSGIINPRVARCCLKFSSLSLLFFNSQKNNVISMQLKGIKHPSRQKEDFPMK